MASNEDDRTRDQSAVTVSADDYRMLFASIDEGYCIGELLFDAAGDPIDYLYLEANLSFRRLVRNDNPVGKTVTQLYSKIEANWLAAFARVVETGESERFESYSGGVDRWFDLYVARVGAPESRRLAIVFYEITSRKRAEISLRESEERQAFVLKLSDALRPLSDPVAVQDEAMRTIGEHLKVSRAFYTEVSADGNIFNPGRGYNDGVAPMPSCLKFSDFGEQMHAELNAGRRFVVDDTLVDPRFAADSDFERMDLRAGIGIPLVKNGRLLAIVSLHQSVPRAWTALEIALLEEIAERTWGAVERVRAEAALRKSEERHTFLLKLSDTLRPLRDPFEVQTVTMRLVAEHLDVMRVCYFKMDPDQDGFSLTAQYERGGLPMPDHMRVTHFAPGMADKFRKGLSFVLADAETDAPTELERAAYRAIGVRAAIGVPLVKDGLFLGVFGVHSITPRRWQDAEIQIIEDVADRIWTAVDRANADAVLQEREERQAFLLQLSDALRALADPMEIQAVAMRVLGQHLRLTGAQYYETKDDGEHFVSTGGYVDGSSAIVQRVRLDDFGAFTKEAYRAGRTSIVNDVPLDTRISPEQAAAYQALGIGAYIGVPLIKAGLLVVAVGVHTSGPHEWTSHEISLVEESVERTWAAVERARAEAELRDSEERFRQFSYASTNVLWVRDAETLDMTFASPAFDRTYGILGPDRGGEASLRRWVRLIEPEDRKTVLANFRRVRAGERVNYEFRIRHAANGALRWIHNTDFPLRDPAGKVQWLAGLCADITGAKEAVDRQGVLVVELQHRTRNLIAVVLSLSDRTLGNAASLVDFGKSFRVRLSALSRVQGLLSHLAAGERVMFDELLRIELAAHGVTDGMADKVTLDGPGNVALPYDTVQTLALALHELATNAVKYGALVTPDGHLTVRWHVERGSESDEPRLHVEWQERGVVMPLLSAPLRGGGYGRELIERALPYQLKAKTSYEFGVDGVRCTIVVPILWGGSE